ncbi:hypothetical protein [Candidatus Arsenophonus triatominarum]|nr:hypothetical protein [Candidatus Arsenophonus triatominarum]
MKNFTELYCLMDDFCKDFEPKMHEILLNKVVFKNLCHILNSKKRGMTI